ncbi:YaaR family protein [Oceanospirillum sediminis]|uniref:YaaR family protein n=1 Tax=Oceanospirillum sediminis TaxID=2760088 RepID=A0A839IR84_9GAMM|nr:YaaR family protein [Oceanospirillum sediminis]MBB1487431.1 YaaR family protein [Oceanospirillum sediminis]
MLNVSDKLKSSRPGGGLRRGKTAIAGAATTGLSFTDHLDSQVEEAGRPSLNQKLTHMRIALDDAGNVLEKNPTLGNLEVYKTLLSNLIAAATRGAYDVQGIGAGWTASEKHHVVKLIDQEAEELLQLVMSEQRDNLKIAGKLVQIKGLVIDLTS